MSIMSKGLILLSLCFLGSQAFTLGHRASFLVGRSEFGQALMATKKRRIRKEDGPPEGQASPEQAFDDDELPDFDLEENISSDAKPKARMASSPSGEAPITSAQMGGTGKPLSSLNDLLADRSLEAELMFDEPVNAEALPSLADFVKGGGAQEEPMGKKKTRQQERREAAIAAAAEEEESGGFFSKLPFLNDDDGDGNSNLNPLKVSGDLKTIMFSAQCPDLTSSLLCRFSKTERGLVFISWLHGRFTLTPHSFHEPVQWLRLSTTA